jgi:inosine-uridine nucleoside N-ribohydrolase
MKLKFTAALVTTVIVFLAVAAVLTPVCAVERVWIDADPACGHCRVFRSDPDDCLAIRSLLRAPNIRVVGISTVFGNAELEVTDRIARDFGRRLATDGIAVPPIYTGAAHPNSGPSAAADRLARALAEGPLTIAAFGPLTNVSRVLRLHPDLSANVTRVVAVMGKREGHVFHPAEGSRDAILRHGPIFSDLNVAEDPHAVRTLLKTSVSIVLVPYELARQLTVTGEDLDQLAARGGSAAWLAVQSRGWLSTWRRFMGRDGFYPFDLLAAEYVRSQEGFRCTSEVARAVQYMKILGGFHALIVGPSTRSRNEPGRLVTYCAGLEPSARERTKRRISA